MLKNKVNSANVCITISIIVFIATLKYANIEK